MGMAAKLVHLDKHKKSVKYARENNLSISGISWSDNARLKHSCLGPAICDMTLTVCDYLMPMIRRPNFSDETTDLPISLFSGNTGNESGSVKTNIPLKVYLEEYGLYLPRDEQILTSAQYCVVPDDKPFVPQLFSINPREKIQEFWSSWWQKMELVLSY